MQFIVIEKFPEPFVCTTEEGATLYFDTLLDAQEEADDCQDGQVVQIS
jgi:hypothetical protein